jgi:2-isopropylmalate synthase
MLEAVVEAGATTVNIPDTVGYTVPSEFAELITRIRQQVRGIGRVVISAHCHDDLGLAVANSLAAVSAGARQVECTVNGIGERAGNTSLEELVMAVRTRADRYSFETGVVSQQLYPTSQLLSEITGAGVQANKAIVGRNAFAHEAGIHQDGMIKNALTYEIMTPESVGVPGTSLVLGKHSGRHALGLHCEQLGFQLERRELDVIYRQFLVLADRQKMIADHEILELIAKGREKKPPDISTAVPDALIESGRHGDHESLASQFPLAYLAKGGAAHLDRATPTFGREHDGEQQEDYLWGV